MGLEDFVPIIVNLDVMLARRKMRSKELAERIGITEQNVSLLKSGKVRGVRFETLEKICDVLDCQPADILEYRRDASDDPVPASSARRRA
jgi:putative transcriptional regulator